MPKDVSPRVNPADIQVQVEQQGRPYHSMRDVQFTKPNPENLKGLTPEEIDKFKAAAYYRSFIKAHGIQDMGHLDKDVKLMWPTNIALAKERTLKRRRDMTPWELGVWEASRDPETGVPPRDVRGTPEFYAIEN